MNGELILCRSCCRLARRAPGVLISQVLPLIRKRVFALIYSQKFVDVDAVELLLQVLDNLFVVVGKFFNHLIIKGCLYQRRRIVFFGAGKKIVSVNGFFGDFELFYNFKNFDIVLFIACISLFYISVLNNFFAGIVIKDIFV